MKLNRIILLIIALCFWQIVPGQTTDKKSEKRTTISGKVLNGEKEPVEGAVFYIDNIKTTYRTKSNGSYKIKVSSSATNLEVRSDDYGSQVIKINGQTDIDFNLKGIDEEKNLAAADTDQIDNSGNKDARSSRPKARKMNTYSNIWQMIRGEVSGVIVSGKSVQIQQGHSLFGSSEPLYVINGVIVPSIDNVNPLEVKSIKVLKGSAAAIYGLRGSNGVLSITLLNGSERVE